MNEFDRINEILTEVGKRDGLEDLCLTPDGTCGLRLEDGIDLCIEWAEFADKLFVYTPLLDLPPPGPERLIICETLAHLNCLSLSHGTLSAHLPTLQVLHQIRLDTADLDVDGLDRALDTLLDERPIMLARLEKALPSSIPEYVPTGFIVPPDLTAESLEIKSRPWLDELEALKKKGVHFRYQACSAKEITELEAVCNGPLPATYRQFLAHTGRGSDLLFVGEKIFFPELLAFRQRASKLLLANRARFELPENAFVFFIPSDIQFLFFHLGLGDDPTVYSYEEGDWRFTQAYESFSAFLSSSIARHAENYETLTQLYFQSET